MRPFVLWAFLGLIAVGAAACTSGGSTTVPTTAAPTATTASNVVLLPTPPPAGATASVTLPGQVGLTPTLTLGPGFTTGTQLFVSTTNYGQTQSAARKTDGTIASCPVVLAVTMYFGGAVPLSSLQALVVQYASMASFLTAGTFTAQFYDLNETQTKDSPLPPAATNGCATAPNAAQVLATATATGANSSVTFSNFVPNANLSPTIATKFGLGSGGSGTIPANEVVGFYVTFSAASASPSPTPTATATATPTPTPTATASASPSAQPSATATASIASLTAGGGTITLPAPANLSGSIPYGTVTNGSGPYVVTYGNYNFTASPAPTVPPNAGTVYAKIGIVNNGTSATGFAGTASTISLTVPATASKTTVTVRMWEMNGLPGGDPLCLGNNVTTLSVAPATGGSLSFLSPFQASTGTSGSNCTDTNLNPFGTGTAVYIMVTDN